MIERGTSDFDLTASLDQRRWAADRACLGVFRHFVFAVLLKLSGVFQFLLPHLFIFRRCGFTLQVTRRHRRLEEQSGQSFPFVTRH